MGISSNNVPYIVIGVAILIVLIISILALLYSVQINNNLTDTNNNIDCISYDINSISYRNNTTMISSNLNVDGNITSNDKVLNIEIEDLIKQLKDLQETLKPYIDGQTSGQLTITVPSLFSDLMTTKLQINGPVIYNGVDITNTITTLQETWDTAVSTGILNVNKTLNCNKITTQNFSCGGFFGGVKAYISLSPSANPIIKLNSGCTFTYVSAGTYTFTVSSNITGILGLPICTSSSYTTYVSQTSIYVYEVICKGGGSNPNLNDPSFLCFMLM